MHYQTTMRAKASSPRGSHARLLRFIAVGCMLAASGGAAAAERTPLEQTLESRGFELVKQQRGVKVYKHRTSKIIRVAAEGVMPAPPAEVREALIDYPAQQGRVDRVSESRILRQSPGWLLVYQRLNLPIISDRDYSLSVHWGDRSGYQWVTYDAASSKGPPRRDGIVRVTNHSGSWQLRPTENGRATFVRFQARIDLAGSLPLWLARSGAGKELPNLFANICRLTDPKRRSRSCN